MKLRSVHYNDEEELTQIDVSMTLLEAALVERLLGCMSPQLLQEATRMGGLYEHSSDAYDCLGRVFNGHYDDGVKGVIPLFEVDIVAG